MYLFGCLYTPPRIQLLSKSQGKQCLADLRTCITDLRHCTICLYEQVVHCNLYLSQGCILCKAHAKSSNHRWDNATFYPCFRHEICHTITNAHI